MKHYLHSSKNRNATSEIDDAVLTLGKKDAGVLEWPISRRPQRFYWWMILGVMFFLGGRIVYLNVFEGAYYQRVATSNSLRARILAAPRGIIYDRYGTALVENVPSVNAFLLPSRLPESAEARAGVLSTIRNLFEIPEEDWQEILHGMATHVALPLKDNLSQREIILTINQQKELPGLELQKSARREYKGGSIFSHLLGYEGKIRSEELTLHPEYLLTDSIGKQGIEKQYESALRGLHGREEVEVDALGHIKRSLGILPPTQGNDVLLNIDAELQKKIHETLVSWLKAHHLNQAAAVALDPRDGAVRALVSIPAYDNNFFARGIETSEYQSLINDSGKPLFNRAISGAYPPGSTFKPMIAAAALAEGIITPATSIESRGGLTVGKFFFGDWKAHGFTDLRKAIAVSSDVYFYTLGGGHGNITGLGINRMKKYANLFGYGKLSGIDLPGEVTGTIPDAEWKKEHFGERWYIGDDYHAAIGQGFITATPLQITNTIATIANGGTLYEPHVAHAVRYLDGRLIPIPPKVITEKVVSDSILKVVREGMRETITGGTAQSLRDLPVEVAGKTGTAQFGNEEKTHGWFVSFAPYTSPTLAMIILVEGQGEEGYNAVPITKDILAWYFSRPE